MTSDRRIGPYAIVASIGAGGMGEVYRARDTRLNRDVAIKVLPSSFATDEERLRRFMIEAQSAGALNHPNILVVHDIGTDAAGPYVVSELLEGRTLREALADGPLPARKAVDYTVQTANGLSAAHEKGIVHRDLKPENIFVTKDGRVKILDFGLAKLTAAEPSAAGPTIAQPLDANTSPGMVLGTVGYMSPEQLRGEDVDARSDIFSLGAVMFEMFSGGRAFKGKTAVETMSAILREDPPDLLSSGSNSASPAVERVVRRCLEKNRDERFQSARDVTFALDAVSNTSGAAKIDAALPPRRRVPAGAAAAIAVAAAVATGGAGYMAGRRSPSASIAQPNVRQLTFRSGSVRGARFTPDPRTVVYSAAWEGKPSQLFTARQDSPESTAINLPSGAVLAVSSTGEMAVSLRPTNAGPFIMQGTLARASLAGGAAREMLERVVDADFSPDGKDLAVVRRDGATYVLEFPAGNVLVSEPYWLSNPRVSADGARVAFIAHKIGGDEGDVEIVDRARQRRTLSANWTSIQGLAWASGGREVWFTATRAGGLRAIWAASLAGAERVVYRTPQRLTLEDIAADGRVLMTGTSMRTEVLFGSLKEKSERKLSWFDWATQVSLSPDAKAIAFTESGEGAGEKYGVYIRPTDGSPAVRLGDGVAGAISPDRKWVAGFTTDNRTTQLFPTGPGTVRTPNVEPIETITGGRWFPDSQRLILVGNEKGHPQRAWSLSLAGGRPQPLTPEGLSGSAISPDGKWLVVTLLQDGQRRLFAIDGGALKDVGLKPDDGFAGWQADSRAVLVASRQLPAVVERVDIESGKRTPFTTLAPNDSEGVVFFAGTTFAADADHYVYSYGRMLGDLFVVEGLK
jgi:serine/threonine protein kinase/Tol biopolymer transport system component